MWQAQAGRLQRIGMQLRSRELRKRGGEALASTAPSSVNESANETPVVKKARAAKKTATPAVVQLAPAPTSDTGDRIVHQYPALVPAILLRRYKRFLADVVILNPNSNCGDDDEIDESEVITIYCPNTGPMVGLLDAPHTRVQLSTSRDPKRKYKYTLEMVRVHNGQRNVWVGVHSASANYMVERALQNQWFLNELGKFDTLQREVKFNKHSRVDFVLSTMDAAGDIVHQKYIEVKSVTLTLTTGKEEEDPCAVFPDTVSDRASKHVEELTELIATRKKAIENATNKVGKNGAKTPAELSGAIVFVVQRNDCKSFMPSLQHDPKFAKLCAEAERSGIQLAAYACSLEPHEASQTGQVKLLGALPLSSSRSK